MDSGSYSQHRNSQVISSDKQGFFGKKKIPLLKDPSNHVLNYRFNTTIRPIRLEAGAISLPQIIQSESSKDQINFLRSFYKLPIFEKCKQLLIKTGKSSAGTQSLITAGQASKRRIDAGSEYRIQQFHHTIHDARTLIHCCLNGGLAAETVHLTVVSLNTVELAKLSHAVITTTRDLVCSAHGYLLLCCLADRSSSIFCRLSEVCLTSFSELIHHEGALHVISHMTRSAEFCISILSIFKKSLTRLIDHPPAVDLLNKIITQHPTHHFDLEFVVDYLNSLCEGTFSNTTLSILRSLILTSSEPRLSSLAKIIEENIKTIIDKPAGFQAINTFLQKTTNPNILSIYEDFCKQFPIQLFVRKYRKILFLTYLQLGTTDEHLINFMIDHLLKKRSNLRYVLKKEDSVWLLLAVICRSKAIQETQIANLRSIVLKITQTDHSLMTAEYIRTFVDCLDGFIDKDVAKIATSLHLKS